jgi:fibro-slime domain-containing protein
MLAQLGGGSGGTSSPAKGGAQDGGSSGAVIGGSVKGGGRSHVAQGGSATAAAGTGGVSPVGAGGLGGEGGEAQANGTSGAPEGGEGGVGGAAGCDGAPCESSTCGNGVVEPGEACDDGQHNGLFYGDGTGCSKTCGLEPRCRDENGVTGACSTACGDGNVDEGEACDDGNRQNHDGCSQDCRVEPGFTCTETESLDTEPCPSNPALQCLVLPTIYRDFDPTTNPDFFFYGKNSVTCIPDASGTTPAATAAGGACPATDEAGPCAGLASATLDSDGKPAAGTTALCRCVFTDHDDTGLITDSPSCSRADGSTRHHIDTVITSVNDIKQWYAGDGLRSTLELAQSGSQYRFASSVMGAPAGSAGTTIADDIHANCLGTARPLESGLFPFDASVTGNGSGAGTKYCNLWPYWALGTSGSSCATGASLTVKSQWDPLAAYDNCPMTGTGGAVPKSDGTGTPLQGQFHDFYFTSETRYLFRYSGSLALAFAASDDVWVYVNGLLVLDLGSTDQRAQASVSVAPDAAGGLELGKIYELAVFHANRQPVASDFELTLPALARLRSTCAHD